MAALATPGRRDRWSRTRHSLPGDHARRRPAAHRSKRHDQSSFTRVDSDKPRPYLHALRAPAGRQGTPARPAVVACLRFVPLERRELNAGEQLGERSVEVERHTDPVEQGVVEVGNDDGGPLLHVVTPRLRGAGMDAVNGCREWSLAAGSDSPAAETATTGLSAR